MKKIYRNKRHEYYVHNCNKCGVEYESSWPSHVICDDCLQKDKDFHKQELRDKFTGAVVVDLDCDAEDISRIMLRLKNGTHFEVSENRWSEEGYLEVEEREYDKEKWRHE